MSRLRCCVIGYPIKHSISPAIQQAALDYWGIPADYTAVEVEPDSLPSAVMAMRDLSFLGANVTIPHKVSILRYLDEIDGDAAAIGAVNTVKNDGGRLKGFNTDAAGFLAGLDEVGFRPEGRRVVLVGAGGAARAIAVGLARAGVQSLTIINRDLVRAAGLAEAVSPYTVAAAVPLDSDSAAESVSDCDLLVNATPVGMKGESIPLWEGISGRALVVDIIYNPTETPLLATARNRGAPAMNGLPMLVHQAARSFEFWTGLPAPLEVMRRSALRALNLEGDWNAATHTVPDSR